MDRTLVLEVRSGPDAGRAFAVPAGVEVVVGRSAPATIVLAGDPTISRRHLALSFDGALARVRDLGSSHGTTVNGAEVRGAVVGPGDLIGAGCTLLRLRLTPTPPEHAVRVDDPTATASAGPAFETMREASPAELSGTTRSLATFLTVLGGPVFAIVDAARGPEVYRRVLECREPKASLFEEPRASELAPYAPYLIAPRPGSDWLDRWSREARGEAWGVYLVSGRPIDDLRRALQRLAITTGPSGGERLYRFYDPRVLRRELPVAGPSESGRFFEAASCYVCEREDCGLDVYRSDGSRVAVETVRIDPRV